MTFERDRKSKGLPTCIFGRYNSSIKNAKSDSKGAVYHVVSYIYNAHFEVPANDETNERSD